MEKKKENIWNLPNVLTILRMLLIPVYWVLMMQGRRLFALGVFLVASATDLLDGYIARKYDLITDFGKLMDPLADKLMVLSVMFTLAQRNFVPWAPLIILLCKEGLMVLGGAVLLKKGVVVYAEKIGKYAQVLVVSSLVLSFFAPEFASLGFPVHLALMWCAVALTLCALGFYGKNGLRLYRQAGKK